MLRRDAHDVPVEAGAQGRAHQDHDQVAEPERGPGFGRLRADPLRDRQTDHEEPGHAREQQSRSGVRPACGCSSTRQTPGHPPQHPEDQQHLRHAGQRQVARQQRRELREAEGKTRSKNSSSVLTRSGTPPRRRSTAGRSGGGLGGLRIRPGGRSGRRLGSPSGVPGARRAGCWMAGRAGCWTAGRAEAAAGEHGVAGQGRGAGAGEPVAGAARAEAALAAAAASAMSWRYQPPRIVMAPRPGRRRRARRPDRGRCRPRSAPGRRLRPAGQPRRSPCPRAGHRPRAPVLHRSRPPIGSPVAGAAG